MKLNKNEIIEQVNNLFSNKKLLLTLIPAVILGATGLSLSGYFLSAQNEYNSHVIGKSNSEVFGQKEKSYVILEYLGTSTSKAMVHELRGLSSINSDLGWYILDYSNYTSDELVNMGIEYDPQYRFVTTTTDEDGKEEKQLLYSSYGLKDATSLDKEFHFVDDYGIPDASDVTKTSDTVEVYYTNLDYDKANSRITLDLKLKTNNSTPMTFDVKNVYVKDLDTGLKDDDFKVTTSVENGRVSFDPYDVEEGSDSENSTPATLPLSIDVPKDRTDDLRGVELVYHIENKNVNEKNDDALKFTTDSGVSINESTSLKLPTPQMTMDTKNNSVLISTTSDAGEYTIRSDDYYYYTYTGSYEAHETTNEFKFVINDDDTIQVNDGEKVTFNKEGDVITFTYNDLNYELTRNEDKTFTVKFKNDLEEDISFVASPILNSTLSLSGQENNQTVSYSLDLSSDSMTYYYRFKEGDDWIKYDKNKGIKESDFNGNRLYVRSEYKYEGENGEITLYSMVGQYVKPYLDEINATFKIRLD